MVIQFDFVRVSLTTLADSPLVAGLYYRNIQLVNTAPTNETHAPLNGIEAAGWKLVYSDKRNLPLDVAAKERKRCNERYSIGLVLDEDGTITDVVANSPADVAKLAPSMKIVAMNSRSFSVERLREAMKGAAHSDSAPIELIVTNSDFYETVHIDYHGGLRYPHLERIAAQPDLLGAIMAPHAGAPRIANSR